MLKKKQKKSNCDNEIMSLKKLSHPNIVKLYDVFQDDSWIYLVMEYIEGESLMSKLTLFYYTIHIEYIKNKQKRASNGIGETYKIEILGIR